MQSDIDDSATTCLVPVLPADTPAPPPFEYEGQTVTPLFDAKLQQWGFWFRENWVKMFELGC